MLHQVEDVTAQVGTVRQLHDTWSREQVALANAGTERLRQELERLSANIALLSGPEHRYTLINSEYERLFPGRPVLGRSIREVIPKLRARAPTSCSTKCNRPASPTTRPK